MKSAKVIFSQYLKGKGMLHSQQREQILEIFLQTERHPTIDDLYELVRKKNPKISLATVYRTMRVICDAGLARDTDFGNGSKRFEHKHRHQHHDHLICLECGKVIEVMSQKIENLQESLAKKYGFTTTRHTMQIFGICKQCNRKKSGAKGSLINK